jgi:CRP-like cAMP-binding protein
MTKQYKLQGRPSIELTMSKKSLAEMFGVSRTSLSRELQKMSAEGLITFDSKSIQILDISILE